MAHQATTAAPAGTTARAPSRADEARAALWLGRVLRFGVLVSAGILLVGLVLFAGGHRGAPTSLNAALGRNEPVTAVRPAAIARGLAEGSPTAYVQLGLLVLILTPTLRVAMTVALFLRQRDRTFAILAAIVLALLLLGLVGVGA
jgi:uncharacterized membrane protein